MRPARLRAAAGAEVQMVTGADAVQQSKMRASQQEADRLKDDDTHQMPCSVLEARLSI